MIRTYDRTMNGPGGDAFRQRRPFKVLTPSVKVLVDLAVLYPQPPHHTGKYTADGFEVRTVVPGDLTEWSMTVDGDWIGRVTYQLMSKDRSETVTHWVPSRVLKPLR
ncbi:hypothetical protein SAMN05421642_11398 [Rhodococcoides kyotonense]|uniref:Uncharacterized protein n=2 Tax=Rhodococcoides kyotonense TaxID=398843 RepID=A0A239LL40_9NOCA|nr:hypothetical protein SAMN05421642_11398 [Rhodococcus kyotonensis]